MTPPHDPPTYTDNVPDHLKTTGQLRADGLRPGTAAAGWWIQTFAGDRWRTELHDVLSAVPLPTTPPTREPEPAPPAEPTAMTIITWTKPVRRRDNGRWVETGQRAPLKTHVSLDGERTVCGFDLPDHANVTTTTTDWHLHTDCYNCAYRLWPDHAPAGYIRPTDSHDFPMRRECPHHPGHERDPRSCPECTLAQQGSVHNIFYTHATQDIPEPPF